MTSDLGWRGRLASPSWTLIGRASSGAGLQGTSWEPPCQIDIHRPELAATLEVMACINEQQDLPCLWVLLILHLGHRGKVFMAWGKNSWIPQGVC